MAHRILVPFELPDPQHVSRPLMERLAGASVVVFGHYRLPEQTPPDAARDQFQEDAQRELDALAADFEEAGAEVTTRLMFGTDRAKAIDQVAIEEDCAAELNPAAIGEIDRILVPLPDTGNLERLAEYIDIVADETTAVTLFHVVETEADGLAAAESMLEEAKAALVELGLDPDTVDFDVIEAPHHDEAIIEHAATYDAIVMGEASRAIADRIFGTLPDRLADRHAIPVVIVRRHQGATDPIATGPTQPGG